MCVRVCFHALLCFVAVVVDVRKLFGRTGNGRRIDDGRTDGLDGQAFDHSRGLENRVYNTTQYTTHVHTQQDTRCDEDGHGQRWEISP